jgi:hypothetical protein
MVDPSITALSDSWSLMNATTAHDITADYRQSTFREKMLEHVFVSELLQEAWLRHGRTIEVLRSEVDSAGYDIVLEYNGFVRHVQLKSSWYGAATARHAINVKLAEKPGGCVVWLFYHEHPETFRVSLTYRFFGGEPGEPLPPLGEMIAKHSKGNAQGVKTERPGLRIVAKAAFSAEMNLTELMERLFGPVALSENTGVSSIISNEA